MGLDCATGTHARPFPSATLFCYKAPSHARWPALTVPKSLNEPQELPKNRGARQCRKPVLCRSKSPGIGKNADEPAWRQSRE